MGADPSFRLGMVCARLDSPRLTRCPPTPRHWQPWPPFRHSANGRSFPSVEADQSSHHCASFGQEQYRKSVKRNGLSPYHKEGAQEQRNGRTLVVGHDAARQTQYHARRRGAGSYITVTASIYRQQHARLRPSSGHAAQAARLHALDEIEWLYAEGRPVMRGCRGRTPSCHHVAAAPIEHQR